MSEATVEHREIWKWELRSEGSPWVFHMPKGSEIVHVGCINQVLCLWAEVSPGNPTAPREFVVHGTGHPIEHGKHIGTAIMPPFVWHVYEIAGVEA